MIIIMYLEYCDASHMNLPSSTATSDTEGWDVAADAKEYKQRVSFNRINEYARVYKTRQYT